jgi:uncharacterized protein (TIGR01244 family)
VNWLVLALFLQAPAPAVAETPVATARTADASLPESLARELIPAYQRLSPTLAIGGQPAPEALARLGEWGFRTVINLRPPSEPGVAAEEEALRAAGLRYVSIPVTAETLDWEAAQRLEAALAESATQATLLHCSSSNRVGALLALIEARAGADSAAALERGRRLGLAPGKTTERVTKLLESRCLGGAC